MAGPLSGKGGTVSLTVGASAVDIGIAKYSIDRDGGVQAYASSKTSGHKQRVAGVKDWKASVDCYPEDGVPDTELLEGAEVECVFTTGTPDTAPLSGNGVIESAKYDIDIENGGLITLKLEIGANGPLAPAS